MRIDRLLSQLKYGSRSQMHDFFHLHEVKINGVKAENGRVDVNPNQDKIEIDGQPVYYKFPLFVMLNKPKGYLSANKDPKYPCAIDLIKDPYHRLDLSIAGRLDLDSEGLLILTNDGTFLHQITHPKSHMPKSYEVVLDHPFCHKDELLKGVMIKDGKEQFYLAKALLIREEGQYVKIVIDEGKFHQVKRMFKAVGYEVQNLKRIQIGSLCLGDLKPGEYRLFEKEELYD
jgi:16S rRNA pseudouridine516 synthase